MTGETKERKPREMQTVGVDPLKQLLTRTGKTKSALAADLGCSPTTLTDCLAAGKMALQLSLACEALLRRLGTDGRRPKTKALLLVMSEPAQIQTLHSLCDSWGVKITEIPTS